MNFNLSYGGKNFRAGANVIHVANLVTKDLSVGFGLAFNCPLFFELGAGYLSRVRSNTSTEGWSYGAKVGCYFPWITQVRYRTRFRVGLVYNQKNLNDNGPRGWFTFIPLFGLNLKHEPLCVKESEIA